MSRAAVIDVVLPARDAQAEIERVLAALPRRELRSIVVVDRRSRDRTAELARDAGAVVLRSAEGYGAACLRALEHFAMLPVAPELVAFVPGHDVAGAASVPLLLAPLLQGGVELTIGRRDTSPLSERVMRGLIEAVYRQRVSGLGSVRALRYPALVALGMSDRGTGWDVEMLVRAVKLGLSIEHVDIPGEASPSRWSGRALFHIARHSTMR